MSGIASEPGEFFETT